MLSFLCPPSPTLRIRNENKRLQASLTRIGGKHDTRTHWPVSVYLFEKRKSETEISGNCLTFTSVILGSFLPYERLHIHYCHMINMTSCQKPPKMSEISEILKFYYLSICSQSIFVSIRMFSSMIIMVSVL